MFLKIGTVRSVDIDNCSVEVVTNDGANIPNVQVSSVCFDPDTGGGFHAMPTVSSVCLIAQVESTYYVIAFVGHAGPRKIPDKANFDVFKSYLSDNELSSKNSPLEKEELPGFRSNRQVSNWKEGDIGIVASNNTSAKFLMQASGLMMLWASPFCNITLDPGSSGLASITTDNIEWNIGGMRLEATATKNENVSLTKMEFNTPDGDNFGHMYIRAAPEGAEFFMKIGETEVKIAHDGSVTLKSAEDVSVESDKRVLINASKNIIMCGSALTIKN